MAEQRHRRQSYNAMRVDKAQYVQRSRRLHFVRALQSDRVTVLVGAGETPFFVPLKLLRVAAPKVYELCSTKKGEETLKVALPEVFPDTFAAFSTWLHTWRAVGSLGDADVPLLFSLVVFAEKYKICRLHDDAIDALDQQMLFPSASMLETVYTKVRQEAPIRRLCMKKLGDWLNQWQHPRALETFATQYRDVLEATPQASWDLVVSLKSIGSTGDAQGPCRYHNHDPEAATTAGGEGSSSQARACPNAEVHWFVKPSQTADKKAKQQDEK
ncbi:hypothetical protein KEM52_004321 [Ascosphaera acerosa]|nr:hypothetical protein KEM52_004321 [Ascosphaera acerosa]